MSRPVRLHWKRVWRRAVAQIAGVAVVGVSTVALISVCVAVSPRGAAQDYGEIAETLLDSGREALQKKRYEAAIEYFEKALEEDSAAIVALYWKAQALERLDERGEALSTYRKYAAMFKTKKADGEATGAESDLATKADARIQKLGEGGRALDRLNETFAKEMVRLAKKYEEDDAPLARDALVQALRADPRNIDAAYMLEQLGGAVPAGEETIADGPFESLRTGDWHDFIARETLGTNVPSYADDRMTIDVEGGKVMQPTERVRLAEGYVYEMDFRVVDEHARGWLAGLVVGWDGGEFYSAFYQQGQVVLNLGDAKSGPVRDIDQHPLPAQRLGQWHRLGVRVKGTSLQVWFDGELVLTEKVDSAEKLQGDVGVFQQRCKTEYRLLRAAVTE